MTDDPLGPFADAMRGSERLRHHRVTVFLGMSELARQAALPRIVIVPRGGSFRDPECLDNRLDDLVEHHAITDEEIAIECRIWCRDYAHLWRVKAALINAAQDYREASNINVQRRNNEYEADLDTSADGVATTVVLVMLAPIDRTPLTVEAGIGTIDAVQITRTT